MKSLHAWHVYWLIWFAVAFLTFLIPEVWALATNPRRTLSWAVWSMEKLVPGQSVWAWHAAHLIFTGILILLFLWLIGHFGFGIWT